MRLKVLIPTCKLIEANVSKVVAEAANGSFGLLPRHVDFVTALVPGILMFVEDGENVPGRERIVGVGEGILVKCADEVLVSVRRATEGDDLSSLRRTVEEEFLQMDVRERHARSATARLEAGVVRRFMAFEE